MENKGRTEDMIDHKYEPLTSYQIYSIEMNVDKNRGAGVHEVRSLIATINSLESEAAYLTDRVNTLFNESEMLKRERDDHIGSSYHWHEKYKVLNDEMSDVKNTLNMTSQERDLLKFEVSRLNSIIDQLSATNRNTIEKLAEEISRLTIELEEAKNETNN